MYAYLKKFELTRTQYVFQHALSFGKQYSKPGHFKLKTGIYFEIWVFNKRTHINFDKQESNSWTQAKIFLGKNRLLG